MSAKYYIRKKWLPIFLILLLCMSMGMVSYASSLTGQSDSAIADGNQAPEEQAADTYEKELQTIYELPVQTNELKGWPQGPGTYGGAAIVMDADSGAILYAKNIDEAQYPASITKVLTVLLAFQYADMSQEVTVTPEALTCLGSGYASIGLKAGDVITMEQAIYAMLLASANEAAYAVGEAVAQSQGEEYDWFIEQMNETCKELGGVNSNFVNTNGVYEDNHYTCARDMALIGKELFNYPEFFQVCQTQQYTIPASGTVEEHVFQQKHHMLLQGNADYDADVIGGKTGYTTEANNTLITMAERDGMRLVCVILSTYSGHSYSDTRALLDYGFANFRSCSVGEEDSSGNFERVEDSAHVILPEGISFDDLECRITPSEEDPACAIAEYFYEEIPVGSCEVKLSEEYREESGISLAEADDRESEGDAENSSDESKAFTAIGIAVSVFLAAALLLIVIRVVQVREQRRRRRRRNRRKRRKRT